MKPTEITSESDAVRILHRQGAPQSLILKWCKQTSSADGETEGVNKEETWRHMLSFNVHSLTRHDHHETYIVTTMSDNK